MRNIVLHLFNSSSLIVEKTYKKTFRLKDLNDNVIGVTFLFVLNIIKYTGLCFLYVVSELAWLYLACMYSSLHLVVIHIFVFIYSSIVQRI